MLHLYGRFRLAHSDANDEVQDLAAGEELELDQHHHQMHHVPAQ